MLELSSLSKRFKDLNDSKDNSWIKLVRLFLVQAVFNQCLGEEFQTLSFDIFFNFEELK